MAGVLKNIGIHARLLSAAVILITATTLTLGDVGVYIISQFVTKRFHQRIDFMTQYLALNCELGILIGEQDLLQGLAENMLKEDDIADVKILDHDDRVLAQGTRRITGPFKQIEKGVFSSDPQESADWIGNMARDFGPDSIGRVQITYSVQGIKDLMARMKKWFKEII